MKSSSQSRKEPRLSHHAAAYLGAAAAWLPCLCAVRASLCAVGPAPAAGFWHPIPASLSLPAPFCYSLLQLPKPYRPSRVSQTMKRKIKCSSTHKTQPRKSVLPSRGSYRLRMSINLHKTEGSSTPFQKTSCFPLSKQEIFGKGTP